MCSLTSESATANIINAQRASSLEEQIKTVKKFTEENFLKLNAAKCEVIIFRKSSVKSNGET